MQYRDRKLKINIPVSKRFRKKNEHYEVIKEVGEPWITSSSADYIKPHIICILLFRDRRIEGMADTPEPERQTRKNAREN